MPRRLTLLTCLALAAPAAALDYVHDIQPLLEAKCLRCHGGEEVKGRVDFSAIDPDKPGERMSLWRDVADAVGFGDMPPEDEAPLSDFEQARLLEFIQGLSYQGERNPGRVTVRRLNRNEYNHTIRDLCQVDLRPADGFPADDVGHGFDNIGDVLSLPPMLMEKYLNAAEAVLDEAIVPGQLELAFAPRDLPLVIAGEEHSGPGGEGARRVEEAGDLTIFANFPTEGRYQLEVTAAVDRIDAQPGGLLVQVEGDSGLEFEKGVKVTASPDRARSYKVSLGRSERGVKRIGLRFVNPGEAEGRKRALVIEQVLLSGPPVRGLPESTAAIITHRPSKDLGHDEAARQVIAGFTRRAFRRPLAEDEVERYHALYLMAAEAGHHYEAALKYALQAVLVSPHFLFRIERDHQPDEHGVSALDDHELASRLSYFLWCSMPDDELFTLADAGKLRDPAVLAAQAQRMLQDPKAQGLVDSFAEQWLQLRLLKEHVPDPERYPEFNPELGESMVAEVKAFFTHVMTQDRPIIEFLDADYTFADGLLASHYGISGVTGPRLQQVPLSGGERGGVMTMAAVLTVTSHPERTSPSRRGKFVLDQIMGGAPPPPPAMVDSLPEDAADKAGKSLRQLLEEHVSNPDCASCHKAIDPIGFGLEEYDAIGRIRRRDDRGTPVDASAELPSGERFDGAAELREILLGPKRERFVRTFSEQMLTFALGRGIDYYDEPTLQAITEAMQAERYRFGVLIEAIVTSYPFTHRSIGHGGRP